MRRRFSRNYRVPWRGSLRRCWRADGMSGAWAWWQDWPWRRSYAWGLLLWERGQGWLRWAGEERTGYDNLGDGLRAPYPYRVAPPARRLAVYLRQWLLVPRLMLRGAPPDEFGPRYRFSWEECSPCWPRDLQDVDRGEEWR